MNENAKTIPLRNYVTALEGWGHQAGIKVRDKLQAIIDAEPAIGLCRLSMAGIKRLDVSFATEAIALLVARNRGARQICLTELADVDVRENIAAAAERTQVAITVWTGVTVEVLGLGPGAAVQDALAFALARPQGVRAAEYAAACGLSIANASSRLKQLWERGFLLRQPGSAGSGGVEFLYRPIG